jgi:hypothetical protein
VTGDYAEREREREREREKERLLEDSEVVSSNAVFLNLCETAAR